MSLTRVTLDTVTCADELYQLLLSTDTSSVVKPAAIFRYNYYHEVDQWINTNWDWIQHEITDVYHSEFEPNLKFRFCGLEWIVTGAETYYKRMSQIPQLKDKYADLFGRLVGNS